MAHGKYYWMKLKDDFFRKKEIKKLRRIAGGDTYTIIYLKLQLMSLEHEGKILFEHVEDTLSDEISLNLSVTFSSTSIDSPSSFSFKKLFLISS